MRQIKQLPEDFIVKEINDVKLNDNGQYCYFTLKKKNYNTLRAIQAIAKKLNINEKNIGFAGNKDKNALTQQVISIYDVNKNIENIKIKDIELKYLGKGNEKIYLGSLKGNEFIITIRNLTNKGIKAIKNKIKNNVIFIPNYFGEQRFSNNNQIIGKAIIKNNFKEVIDLIIKNNSDYNEKIEHHLQKQKNDFVVALKIIPFRLLKLYIHSYQSFLFNKALEQYIKLNKNKEKDYNKIKSNNIKINNNKKLINQNINLNNKKNNELLINVKIPLIGFATELSNKKIEKIIKKILEQEQISPRDFIIRSIPDLSQEGSERNAFININDFKIINIENDELNKNKEKIIVKFSLPKGSFATVLVDYLFDKTQEIASKIASNSSSGVPEPSASARIPLSL